MVAFAKPIELCYIDFTMSSKSAAKSKATTKPAEEKADEQPQEEQQEEQPKEDATQETATLPTEETYKDVADFVKQAGDKSLTERHKQYTKGLKEIEKWQAERVVKALDDSIKKQLVDVSNDKAIEIAHDALSHALMRIEGLRPYNR